MAFRDRYLSTGNRRNHFSIQDLIKREGLILFIVLVYGRKGPALWETYTPKNALPLIVPL